MDSFIYPLRTVPTFVTAHTFCASRDTCVSDVVPANTGTFFARFKAIRRKQNFASALGIQKENQFRKKMPDIALYFGAF